MGGEIRYSSSAGVVLLPLAEGEADHGDPSISDSIADHKLRPVQGNLGGEVAVQQHKDRLRASFGPSALLGHQLPQPAAVIFISVPSSQNSRVDLYCSYYLKAAVVFTWSSISRNRLRGSLRSSSKSTSKCPLTTSKGKLSQLADENSTKIST